MAVSETVVTDHADKNKLETNTFPVEATVNVPRLSMVSFVAVRVPRTVSTGLSPVTISSPFTVNRPPVSIVTLQAKPLFASPVIKRKDFFRK
ncbi:hypothetical protein DPMN_003943 [Dreissena polymorpha]|uniref:Uncharacterized protein n=1 Tax=Dreissena polymorpha TaxID=45954 RepID=A0A9D4MQU7_DREPO|nr:hypothetical protein DPMN_003943 [Dreissena polymorpha]